MRHSHEDAELEDPILSEQLRGLPGVEGPPAAAVLLAARRRSGQRRRLAMGSMAMAALALVAVAIPSSSWVAEQRARGLAVVEGSVQLQALAEGPSGRRVLADGASVRPSEQVVFQALTDAEGTLTLSEGTRALYPVTGAWSVAAGAHFPGGASPLAYRPDEGSGARVYTVVWCSAAVPSECAEDSMILLWEAAE